MSLQKFLNAKISFAPAIKNYPNSITAISGVIGFVIFYLWARQASGINQDLLINLAASSLVICATVLIVEKIKERHRRLTLEGAAVSGVSKIQMSNFDIIHMLGNFHYNDLNKLQTEYIKAISKTAKVPKKNYTDDYIDKMLKIDIAEQLKGMDKRTLTRLLKYFGRTEDVCSSVALTYSYALSNSARESLIKLNETLGMTTATLANLVDLNSEANELSASYCIWLYLNDFRKFQVIKKY